MSDLRGAVILVTGGNAGIGKETAVELARQGASVVITSRDATRGASARDEIRTRTDSTVDVVPLNLASFASVRACADQLLSMQPRIDVLVLNAGGILARRDLTEDGHETQFQANHLGHFLLTHLLRERLVASTPSRVVVVASDAHKTAKHGLDFDDLEGLTGSYHAFQTYARTKLMNILFTRELARRLAGTGVTANSLHPGFVASRFGKDDDLSWWGNIGMPLSRPFSISPERGARTSVYLASSPAVATTTGEYFKKSRIAQPNAAACDNDSAARLWSTSEHMVASFT